MGHSGGVSFPAYLQDTHQAWLVDLGNYGAYVDPGEDITSVMMSAIGASPYSGKSAFDPKAADSLVANSPLYDNDAMLDALNALVDGITAVNDGTQWDTLFTKAGTKIDAAFTKEVVSSEMAAAVTAAVKASTSIVEDDKTAQKGFKKLFADDATTLLGYHLPKADTDLDTIDTTLETQVLDSSTGSLKQLMDLAQVQVKAFIDAGISAAIAAGNSAIADAEITSAVNAYETSRLNAYYRNLNRFTGGMVDINAVHTTSFMMGVVSLNKDLANDVDAYEAQLRLQTYGQMVTTYMSSFMQGFAGYLQNYGAELSNRLNGIISMSGHNAQILQSIIAGYFTSTVQAIVSQLSGQVTSNNVYHANRAGFYDSAVREMVQLIQTRLAAKTQATQVGAEVNRIRISAQKENVDETTYLAVQNGLWDLEVYRYGANVMAAISGAPAGTAAPSRAQSALAGAAMGAAVGSMVPLPGATAVGAGIGAIIGAVAP